MHVLTLTLLAAIQVSVTRVAVVPRPCTVGPQDADGKRDEGRFTWPCDDYSSSVHGKSFGAHVTRKGSPFRGSWHLAEDVWQPGGTEVRAVADGVVRYSAFSPTWTEATGIVHWNLGNVIVIEHTLDPPEKVGETELAAVCSFYVHLAADRRVQVGDRVARGQVIGRIGVDKSDENGRYPAHLHFGLHRGPYVQVPPSLVRELSAAARSTTGLRFGDQVLRGELDFRMSGETSVLITAKESGESMLFSLLVGSTAPKDPPPDIMAWCEGYGPQETLAEWLAPSKFLRARVGSRRR
ncbi:MAG: M23 family metallopeptidase [bacterium]|nr:M23 family metallopeptidase [bacterium]